MKSVIIFSFLILSTAYAEERGMAYKIICQPMKINSEILECVSKVRTYLYYNLNALKICSTLVLNSEKISCLDIIGDVDYERSETDKCSSLLAEEDKRECLQNLGRIHETNIFLK
jgi:hypothetical protein